MRGGGKSRSRQLNYFDPATVLLKGLYFSWQMIPLAPTPSFWKIMFPSLYRYCTELICCSGVRIFPVKNAVFQNRIPIRMDQGFFAYTGPDPGFKIPDPSINKLRGSKCWFWILIRFWRSLTKRTVLRVLQPTVDMKYKKPGSETLKPSFWKSCFSPCTAMSWFVP